MEEKNKAYYAAIIEKEKQVAQEKVLREIERDREVIRQRENAEKLVEKQKVMEVIQEQKVFEKEQKRYLEWEQVQKNRALKKAKDHDKVLKTLFQIKDEKM